MMDDNATTATAASSTAISDQRAATTSIDNPRMDKGYAHEFIVNQPIFRVYRNFKHTDEWMPFLFTSGFDGKRIYGTKQGEVGCAYKATYYEVTTSFAKDYVERFEIISWQKPLQEENNNIGEIIISHRPNARSSKGWQELFIQFVPVEGKDNKEDTQSTMVSIGYPTKAPLYRASWNPFSLGMWSYKNSKQYKYRLDSINDLKKYLSI